MTLTSREFWTALHGMILGAMFLLLFAGTAAAIWNLRGEWTTRAGRSALTRVVLAGSWSMAVLAWLSAGLGTFVIYPWYRATPPRGTTPALFSEYPKSLLISKKSTAEWHTFGMEWKEHIGWLAPVLATGVAAAATMSRRTLAEDRRLRQAMLILLSASFFCAGVAGFFGAMINKMAGVR